MNTMTPTPEQQKFIDAVGDGRGIVCQAGAGAGKTTVMRAAAHRLVQRGEQGIYTAFNRAIVDSAKGKFPRGVAPMTTYAIAFRSHGRDWQHRLNMRGQTLRDVARILRISNPLFIGKDVTPLNPSRVARLALSAVSTYCGSADDDLAAHHVPELAGADENARAGIATTVLEYARRAWADMADAKGGKLACKHNVYFKAWALTHPQIAADFLMVDECQDTDPVLAAVLREQEIPMYLIGDDAQMIYGWRGCESIMGDFPTFHQLTLTKSFRFGPAVADEANKWLELLDAKIRIQGHDPVRSVVGSLATPDAVLCRTNAGAVSAALEAFEQGRKVHLKGAGDDIKAIVEGAAQLQAGQQAWHPELETFGSWQAVVQHVEDGMASTELEAAVRLIDTHGVEQVQKSLAGTVSESAADVVVTTCHKVKGLEWDQVQIGDDWHAPRRGGDVPDDTAMLAYVAFTRAKTHLDRGGLAWVDHYVDAPAPLVAPVAAPAQAPRVLMSPRQAAAVAALKAAQGRAGQTGYGDAERLADMQAIVDAYLDQRANVPA